MRVSKIVEDVLRENVKSRNSDKVLLIFVYRRLGLDLTASQIYKLLDMPSAETITRVRRKLQEQGKYVADKSIAKERNFRSMQMQQNAPNASPKRIEDIVEGTLPKNRSVNPDDIELPPTNARKVSYIFKGHDPFNDYIKGQQYNLVLAPLQIGKPITVISPFERNYKDLIAFNKLWGVTR